MTQLLTEPLEQTVTPRDDVRGAFVRFWEKAKDLVDSGTPFELSLKPRRNTRSLQANACMWAHLTDISRQVDWYGHRLTAEEWKEVLSASLRVQRVVPGVDAGSFVVLGARTSRMSIQEMGEMIELIQAFGAERGVRFTAPAWQQEWAR